MHAARDVGDRQGEHVEHPPLDAGPAHAESLVRLQFGALLALAQLGEKRLARAYSH